MLPRSVYAVLFGTWLATSSGAQVPRIDPSRTVPLRAAGEAACASAVRTYWQNLGKGGKIACGAPDRPAILLVHGLHQSMTTWTAPSDIGYSYDWSRNPAAQRIGDTHEGPNAGVYKLATSDWLYGNDRAAWDREHNWFDYLAGLGFTVATWSQPGSSDADALPSAHDAFDSLLAQTKARNPAAPPAVALIGHSRGGLVIRQILKDRKGAADIARLKWVVTLHTPHQGSDLGQWPGKLMAETMDLMDCCAPTSVTTPLKQQLRGLVTEAMRPMTKLLVGYESRELTPGGPLLRSLEAGETALPGVRYYTFGGTSPNYFRIYAWVFDANSANPQVKNLSTYFVWRADAVDLGPISPVLDKIRPFVREVKEGYGDGLVTDASARLPWSTHFTDHLNHAEVLWDRTVQAQVARLIDPALFKVP